MNGKARYQEAKKVTLLGAWVNAFLGIIKVFGGVLFHSHALVADGIHSFADLVTDTMVIFASKYGSQAADESHPYGHQRIETAATLLLALVLILAGAGIAWDSIDELVSRTYDAPQFLALPIAILSILANEGLFHYTAHIGKKIQSELIKANAWHHRTDAASSVVVLIGLLASFAGFSYVDAVAAIVVALMIIKMGINYGWNSVKELVDTAVEPDTLAEIERIIKSIDGVKRIHQLRSRMMGNDVFIDVHILVSPLISVSEGHYIAQHVHHGLVSKMRDAKDVTVHVDPEDDEIVCPSYDLPKRSTLDDQFLLKWQREFPGLDSWTLHYLDGKLRIDLLCQSDFKDADALYSRVKHDAAQHPDIDYVRILGILNVWQPPH